MLSDESIGLAVDLSEDSRSPKISDKPKNSLSSSEMPELCTERKEIEGLEICKEQSSLKNLELSENKDSNLETVKLSLEFDCQETDMLKEQQSYKNIGELENTLRNLNTQNFQLNNRPESESFEQQCSYKPEIALSNSEVHNSNREDKVRLETDISELPSPVCLDSLVSPLPSFEALDPNPEHNIQHEIKPSQEHDNDRNPLLSFDNLESKIQQEIEPSQEYDNHRSPLPSFEISDPIPECNIDQMTEPLQEQDNTESPLALHETPGPNLEHDSSSQEMNSWEDLSPRKRDKPKNSLPYFEMPNPDLEQFILETSETMNVASKPLSCLAQSATKEKVVLKPCDEEFITFDIVEPLTAVDKFKSKFISQIQNKHKEVKASEPKLINLDEETAPGSKHLVLKEMLKKKIAEKKFLHLKERKMFRKEVSDVSSDEDEIVSGDKHDQEVGETIEPNGSNLQNASEDSDNSNDVDPCFFALRKPDQNDEQDEAAEGESDGSDDENNDEDEKNSCDDLNNDELDYFHPTSTLKDCAKESQLVPRDDLSDSDAEAETVLPKKKCQPLADLSDEESMDHDQPNYNAIETEDGDENSRSSLPGKDVIQSQILVPQQKSESFRIETDDEGNISISDIPSYQPNGGFRFQDSADRCSQDSSRTSQSSGERTVVPNFMIPSFVPLGKTLSKTAYSHERRTDSESTQIQNHVGFKGLDSLSAHNEDSQNSYDDVAPFCSGSFQDGKVTQQMVVSKDSRKKTNNGLKGIDNLSVQDEDSQNSYDDVAPFCSGSFEDGCKAGNTTQPVVVSKDSKKVINNGFKGLDDHSICDDDSQNSYDDVAPFCSGSFKDGKITQPVIVSKDSQKKTSNGILTLVSDEGSQNSYDDVIPSSSGAFHDVSEDCRTTKPGALNEQPTTKVWDYFDDEAELSGEDQGSDGDSEDELAAEIEEEFEAAEEGLEESDEQRRKAAELYMKRLQDDDIQNIRNIKEMFLEGELGDQSGRSRKFVWSKSGTVDVPLNQGGDSSSDSENENDVDVSVKFSLNAEKTKWQMQSKDETEETAVLEIESLGSQGKISRAGMFGMSKMKTQQNFRKRTRGSAFCMDESLLKKFKLEELGS